MEGPKFNWKRLLITAAYVVITAGVIGGVTWYVMDKNAKADKEQYEKQIRELEEQTNQEKAEAKVNETDTKKDESSAPVLSTYTNTKYNFTFKYPSTVFVRDVGLNPEGIYTVYLLENKYKDIEGESPSIALNIYPKKGSALNLWITGEELLNYTGGLKQVTIAGKEGYYFESSGMVDNVNYGLFGNSAAYGYVFTAPKNYAGPALLDIVNSIKFN